ncbi:hypothetical protein AB4455_10205 [Vibrio sp. 10N.261.46.E12]|uniref:hypothetical protein n=1 Tax=unclassified Vibrio TaxID=2614977 RepID=UPI00097796C5|nr:MULTISPECIES: hypothetical protein [unclassified Vibrio]OMO36162.1 hypothetical protein BH584_05140 [Vibrio sp. 10N.261.45.E1]PMJ34486.1 hypothetical protein BCU27_03395 [Vibrio sp. 10N.286.45.B6]PML88014.1 hypothetical protein BCT66_10465 [Vibrio sp. 10N.261.49.E11]PMM67341.1 hypothetical protein BCT48_14935 [Vibrio sp. 10N.261.46.F12]PMM81775.1 hypothetical protein BCT46_15320 [Vibrio sp. 10N.261.46.E8]
MKGMTNPVRIRGLIPALAVKEFSAEERISKVLPQDIISLLKMALHEFGEEQITYEIQSPNSCMQLDINNLGAEICATDISGAKGWAIDRSTTGFSLRSVLPENVEVTLETVSELNISHPSLKFYLVEERLVIEDAFDLSYGVSVLELIERMHILIKTIDLMLDVD